VQVIPQVLSKPRAERALQLVDRRLLDSAN
jgi:hypothetical protein